MKTQNIILSLSLSLAVGLIAGCEKKPDQVTLPEGSGNKATTEAGKLMDAAKPAAEQAVKQATDAANTVAADATAKANALIEQAKTLLGQSKYTEALNSLQQLSGIKLTAEQEKLVASLKEQVQKAMAAKATTDAAGAAGGLLPK